MPFKPCIVIPVYNHHINLRSVVESLRHHQTDCFIMDDGSSQTCKETIEALAQNEPWLSLHRFETNRGKGAVVCDGLRYAYNQGFTHCLQVDSDGQHDLNDITTFFEAARHNPNAVIAGTRNYSAMPKNRRYGRRITDTWVWINTLSLKIKDSMCGYRLYPLKQTIDLLDNTHIGQRMDFDTDIMVRLYWNDIDLIQIDTAVLYQEEITSHFDLVRDNLRISKMHTKHFFGMLKRAPRIITKRLKWTY